MCAHEVDRLVAQRYLLKRRLGKGAYGIVWKAVDRRTGEVVAIKKIFDAFRDKTDAQRTFREVVLLQEFGDHPNIIRLLDVIPAENDTDIYLVFEFMDTDLNAVIRKGTLLEDSHKRFIFYQLLQATKFIHSGHVVHRDQKPSNVLLDADCSVKLCDFGLARSLSQSPEGPEDQALTEYVATRWYRAPEVLLSSRRYSPGVDMWSLGCILGEMLRGQPLFPGTSTVHQLQLILDTVPPASVEDLLALGSGCSGLVLHHTGSGPRHPLDALLPPETPPEALDLLRRLLVLAPDRRLTAAQALQHPYVQRFNCSDRTWTRGAGGRLPAPDGAQLSAPEYRRRLYQMIRERWGLGGAEGAGSGTARAQRGGAGAPLLQQGAAPQTSETRGAGPGPQSRVGPDPEASGASGRVPGRNSGSLLRPPAPDAGQRPPGRDMGPPFRVSRGGAGMGGVLTPAARVGDRGPRPLQVEPGGRGAAPSLTSQAAANAVNRALIRHDAARVGALRVSPIPRGPRPLGPHPRPLGPVLHPPALTVPLTRTQDPPRPPRPGRRVVGTSASQGAQGAARAALGGGYSQAYGTVSCSALAHLPLRPGPDVCSIFPAQSHRELSAFPQ
ncbi:mitogen-activated protein kinase 15 [Ctenodactylus gundi]